MNMLVSSHPRRGTAPSVDDSLLLARRGFLTGALGAGILMSLRAEAATNTVFDVTQPPFNADQTGAVDATSAFQAVLNIIQSYGRGTIRVPAGAYTLGGPLTIVGANLTMIGDGQEASLLVITHKGTGLFAQCTESNQCVTIRDVGFAPVPSGGGPAGVAVSIKGLPVTSGWQGCSIQDVDLGSAFPNYTSFSSGLVLTDVWRGRFEHINMHSNIGKVPGSSFALISGCIDLAFAACNVDQISNPINVTGYSEGLRFQQCAFVGNVGISTGPSPYIGNGSSSPLLCLLDLNLVDCEFNCTEQSLALWYVNTGLITGCHFSGSAPFASVHLAGSEGIQIQSSSITGNFNANSPQVCIGVKIEGEGSPVWRSTSNCVDNCEFSNLSCGVYFGGGSYINSATSIRMLAPGAGDLVLLPEKFGPVTMAPYVDGSGNATNYASAIGEGSSISSGRTTQLTNRQ